MSALELVVSDMVDIDRTLAEAARADLAALRAKAAEYDRIADLIDPNGAWTDTSIYDQIINLLHDDSSDAALRAQVETAREIMEQATFCSCDNHKQAMNAWLAANAPAQKEEQA